MHVYPWGWGGRALPTIYGMSADFPAFELTEELQELRAVVRALADDKIAPRAAEVDESGEFPWDVHEALAKAELTAVHIPEAYGITQIYEGTNQIQRTVMARQLLK